MIVGTPFEIDTTGWTINRDSGAVYDADGTWMGSVPFPSLPPVGECGKDYDVVFEGPVFLTVW
jgi:hypothetical protein